MLGIRVPVLICSLADETEPVIWRAPVITTVIKQFYSDTDWGNLDVLIIDMPPGTGDALDHFPEHTCRSFLTRKYPSRFGQRHCSQGLKMANMMQVQVLGLQRIWPLLQMRKRARFLSLWSWGEVKCSLTRWKYLIWILCLLIVI